MIIPFLLFLFFSTSLFANNSPCIDINYTPYSGAENIISIQKGFEKIENRFLPDPVLSEKDLEKPGLPLLSDKNRLILASKSLLFWLPFNSSCVVTQHEVFGHGYRIRDLGPKYAEVKGYKMYVFGGATSVEIRDKLTLSQSIAIDIAGLEADEILANKIKMQWLDKGQVDPRQYSLYFLASTSLPGYAVSVCENPATIPNTGNDIINFLFSLNTLYRDNYLTYVKLRNLSFINFLDPFLFYAISAEIHYCTSGRTMSIPMFKIGPVQYLPTPRVVLTPFGIQGCLDNYFVFQSIPTHLHLKWGKNGANTYYGIGLENQKIFRWKTGSLGCRMDLWHEPHVLFQQGMLSAEQIQLLPEGTTIAEIPELYSSSVLKEKLMGAAFSLIGTYGFAKWPMRLYLELGYKSRGYLSGEALRASPIARGGLSGQF